MMKVRLNSFIVPLVVVIAFCGISIGTVWVPGGTEYVAPEGGTLVLSEDYGSASGRDGAGSWLLDGNAQITQEEEYITISFATGASGSVTIPFSFVPRLSDYVIDVGLIGWERIGGATATNAQWHINSSGGSGMRHRWNVSDNLITAEHGIGGEPQQSMPYMQNTEYVIRFSDSNANYAPKMILNFARENEVCATGYSWSSPGGDFLRIYAASTGASNNHIAWIRVYTGVSTYETPIAQKDIGVPWTPFDAAYLPPEYGILALSEDYGTNYDSVGSWVAGSGTPTIAAEPNSLLITTLASRAQINLPFQPEGSAGIDYVIDVGVKGWSTTNYRDSWWHSIWWIQSAAGNGMHNRWVTNSNNLMGMMGEETIPYPQNTEYVLRFSSTAGLSNPVLTSNFGAEGASEEPYAWNTPKENFFAIYGSSNAPTTTEIVWVRIYTGVSTTDAPLEAPLPETVPWTPAGTEYSSPVGGVLFLAEDYGSDYDGYGSWTTDENSWIIETADSIGIFTNGGYAKINLPFQLEGAYGTDYVIDVGLKGWSAEPYRENWSHIYWWIQSAAGSGLQHRWVTTYGDLKAHQNEEAIPFPMNKEFVMRFSSRTGYNPVLTTNLGDDGSSEETGRWSAPFENFFGIYGTENAVNLNVVSWVRIYTGVTTTAPPLVAVQTPDVLQADISGEQGEPDGFVDIYDLIKLVEDWLQTGSL